MSEFIKKMVYTSIGAASVTNEKFKELLEDLIQNQHFTEDEGKRIIDSFLVDLRLQIDTFNSSLQLKADDFFKKFGFSGLQTIKQDVENYVQDVKDNPTILLKLPSKK